MAEGATRRQREAVANSLGIQREALPGLENLLTIQQQVALAAEEHANKVNLLAAAYKRINNLGGGGGGGGSGGGGGGGGGSGSGGHPPPPRGPSRRRDGRAYVAHEDITASLAVAMGTSGW